MPPTTSTTTAPTTDDLERHRRELTAHCYRMLGSGADAEDAAQETLVRAWQAGERFAGRSSVRTWLYKIATNVCLDVLRSAHHRRSVPMELGAARPPVEASLADILPEGSWVSPIADERVLPMEADPAVLVEARESIRLAFVATLQHLPPRQRAVLILCDVLRWPAAEVAPMLDTTVPAVNSALQRARATLAVLPSTEPAVEHIDAIDRDVLARYVTAFERYDIDALVQVLRADAIQSMPPFAMWLSGAVDISRWLLGPGAECRGSRLVPTAANGCAAFGQYRADPAGGHSAWALQVVETAGGKVSAIHSFLDVPQLFPAFDLPPRI